MNLLKNSCLRNLCTPDTYTLSGTAEQTALPYHLEEVAFQARRLLLTEWLYYMVTEMNFQTFTYVDFLYVCVIQSHVRLQFVFEYKSIKNPQQRTENTAIYKPSTVGESAIIEAAIPSVLTQVVCKWHMLDWNYIHLKPGSVDWSF